jgi:tRNA(fMet)-specific endonuclease VapC
MKESLIDTDILSYYMRGLREVVPRAQKYLKQFGHFNVSSLTVFEILKGLRKKRLVEKEKIFQTEILKHKVFGLDYAIMDTAATLLTDLEDKGTPIAYGDLFVAATTLTHDLILVTNNTKHFSKVEGLVLENWTKP